MKSLWRYETENIEPGKNLYKGTLNEEKWDVIVIGAGMAGILTAYYLKEKGKKVLVLEADKIASGQTERTTAKITSQHALKYSKLIKTVGIKKAKLYMKANQGAIKEYERLIKANDIDCDFEKAPAYLYTLEDENPLIEEKKAAESLGLKVEYTNKTELPFPVKGAIYFENQAQFSPLKFIKHIAEGLEIRQGEKVIKIKGNKVITEYNVYMAEKIVVATHYPIFNAPGFYFLRQHQERSYVLALSGCKEIKGMYYGIDKNGLSLRQAGDALLLGGGGHRTGDNKAGTSYDFLNQAAREYYPDSREITRWSAQDCIPHDGIPFIGRYSIFTPNRYVITGFQKWGMTSSMIAAIIIRDEICGIKNPYRQLFSPQRINIIAGFKNLMADIGESVKGLSAGWLHFPKKKATNLPNGHGGVIIIDGKRFACYRDENGVLHKISARCPHLGCELTWNPDEKSWDCPCHGSRFDIDGNLLDNPSKKDVQQNKQ